MNFKQYFLFWNKIDPLYTILLKIHHWIYIRVSRETENICICSDIKEEQGGRKGEKQESTATTDYDSYFAIVFPKNQLAYDISNKSLKAYLQSFPKHQCLSFSDTDLFFTSRKVVYEHKIS